MFCMLRFRSPLLVFAIALLMAGGVAFGADPGAPPEPGRLPEAVSRIERETGARVLSAQRSQRGGREVNRIKLITPEGRVRVMWDDPQRARPMGGSPFLSRPGERSPHPAADAVRRNSERNGGPRDER